MKVHPGKRIKELRQRKGWGLTELAEASKTSKSAISRLENEEVGGRPAAIDRIAKALGVDVPALYALPDRPSAIPLDGIVTLNGWLVSRSLAWPGPSNEAPSPLRAIDALMVQVALQPDEDLLGVAGAPEDAAGWFAVRSQIESSVRYPRLTGHGDFELQKGDVIAFQPSYDSAVHDKLVAVEMGDRIELRLIRKDVAGRFTLYPLAQDVDHEPLRAGWKVLAVAVELRRSLLG